MKLTVSIAENLQEWMMEKGNTTLTISKLHADNGCCVPTQEILTRFTKPKQMENFHFIKVDNLPIYIDKSLSFKNEHAHLELSGILFKTIRVIGLQRF